MDNEFPGLKTLYSYKELLDWYCSSMGLKNYSYEDVEVSDNYYIRYFDDGKTNYLYIVNGDVLFFLIYTNTTQSLQKNKEDLRYINEFIRPKSGELGPRKTLPEKSTSSAGGSSSSTATQPFTNKYGTATTKCAHSGCNNYIASSGDTNCCPVHSKTCKQCGKYIDEDAFYCMQCLMGSAGSSSSSNSSYSSTGAGSFTNKYGTKTTKCAHIGCNNYIASSGDTNCCPTHSKHCAKCGKYIDEDAMYCMQCLLGY